MSASTQKHLYFRLKGTPGGSMSLRLLLLATFILGMLALFWRVESVPWGIFVMVAVLAGSALLVICGVLATVATLRADLPRPEMVFHVFAAAVLALLGAVVLLQLVRLGVLALTVRRELGGILP